MSSDAQLNLLTSPWLPVAMPDGSVRKISVKEVPTSGALHVAHPRADFSALATELVLEIFQTLATPADKQQRREMLKSPTLVDFSRMDAAGAAFEVFGPGNRFLQTPEDKPIKDLSARSLAFEAPGAQTVKQNKALFASVSDFASMCPHCAPIGLFLCQAHARSGGKGYSPTIRGGSALTVLIKAPTLWETITKNLLTEEELRPFLAAGADRALSSKAANPSARNLAVDPSLASAHSPEAALFPWMLGPETFTVSSQKLTPLHYGPYACFWWTPVAVRLFIEPNEEQASCSTCGEVHKDHVQRMWLEATKAKLPENFLHPRTAWRWKSDKSKKPDTANADDKKKSDNVLLPNMAPKVGLTIQDWLSLNYGRPDAPGARAVAALKTLAAEDLNRLQLWSFGASMDKSELLTWHEERSPFLVAGDAANAADQQRAAAVLVELAEKACSSLKAALTGRLWEFPKESKGGVSSYAIVLRESLDSVARGFEHEARSRLLSDIQQVDEDTGTLPAATVEAFQLTLNQLALRAFDRVAQVPTHKAEQARFVLGQRHLLNLYTLPTKPKEARKPKAKKAA